MLKSHSYYVVCVAKWGVEDVAPYCFITKFAERNGKLKKSKEKRKANGNLTRRPPARLIALYTVFKVSVKPFQRLGGVRGGSPEKALKKKRKVNGNLTRRPPARLIALYKVFKVSLKPFQRLVGFGAKPRENT